MPTSELPQAGCTCGHAHDSELPEVDARQLPHAIRHGAIIGAFSQLPVGGAMVLVAPHDPLPLLAQLHELHGDALQVSYLDRNPEAVRLKLAKV